MTTDSSSFLENHAAVAAGLDLFDQWLGVHVANHRLPGLSIGIVYDQALMWAKGYGYADLASQTPATPETLYRIASNTKMFTATAILQLRDAGQLALDDPVSNHLPWFSIHYRADQNGDQPPITIRHLLTHTSGLPRDATIPIWADNIFPSWEQLVETTPQREAALLTDEHLSYSNLGYALAGGVIEAVSGKGYADYVNRHILKPLAMHRTRVGAEPGMDGLATGYMRPDPAGNHAVADYSDIQGFLAGGGITSNVAELARFVRLQFRDEPPSANPVLRGGTIREMHRVQWMRPDWQSGWGLGLSLRRIGERVVAGHGGALKGYLTQTAWCRDEKFGVIALTNAQNGSPGEYVDQAFKMIAPLVQQAVSQPVPEADPAWQQYKGKYYANWGFDLYVTIERNQLVVASLDWINEPRTVLEPVATDTFRVVEGGNLGELCVFERNEAGEVIRMRIGSNKVDRVK